MGLLDGTTQQSYYNGSSFGNYQFTSLNNIIDNFIVAYIGDGKIIKKLKEQTLLFTLKELCKSCRLILLNLQKHKK